MPRLVLLIDDGRNKWQQWSLEQRSSGGCTDCKRDIGSILDILGVYEPGICRSRRLRGVRNQAQRHLLMRLKLPTNCLYNCMSKAWSSMGCEAAVVFKGPIVLNG